MPYTIFIDESGSYNEDLPFIVGGYIVEHENSNTWSDEWQQRIIDFLPADKIFTNDYNQEEILSHHRFDYKKHCFKEAMQTSKEFFEEFQEVSFFYISIKKEELSDLKSTGVHYIDLLTTLALENCFKIIQSQKRYKDIIDIRIVAASRDDINEKRKLRLGEYQEFLEKTKHSMGVTHGIHDSKITDGGTDSKFKISIDVNKATDTGKNNLKVCKDENNIKVFTSKEEMPFHAGLILADYFCNVAYGKNKNKEDKTLYNELVDQGRVSKSDYYKNSLDITLYSYNRNYLALIQLYINYQCHFPLQEQEIKQITQALQIRERSRDSLYYESAVRTTLHLLEQESSRDKNYPKIEKLYNILLQLNTELNTTKKDCIQFLILREKLALCNHWGNSILAGKTSLLCEQLVPMAMRDPQYREDVLIFYQLSSNYYNSVYQSHNIIKYADERILLFKQYYELNKIYGFDDLKNLGSYYGSLGTGLCYQYLVDKNPQTVLTAEEYYLQALECFSGKNDDIKRTYNNLLHLFRHAQNDDKFQHYTALFLGLSPSDSTDTIITELQLLLTSKEISSSATFFFRELLIYANHSKSDLAEKLSFLIRTSCIEFVEGLKEDGDPNFSILREWALLIHLRDNVDTSNLLKKQREKFRRTIDAKRGYANSYDVLKVLSLELTERLVLKQFEGLKALIDHYIDQTENVYYKQALTLSDNIQEDSIEAIHYYLNSIYS